MTRDGEGEGEGEGYRYGYGDGDGDGGGDGDGCGDVWSAEGKLGRDFRAPKACSVVIFGLKKL